MLLSRDLPVLRIMLRLESKKERVSQDFRGLKKIEWIEHYVSSLFLKAVKGHENSLVIILMGRL